jgi:hypothetical protein
VGVIVGVVVLVSFLAFIIQNSKSVKVSIFTVSANISLGVALLLAAVCWPGSWRHHPSGNSVTACTNRSEIAALVVVTREAPIRCLEPSSFDDGPLPPMCCRTELGLDSSDASGITLATLIARRPR